MENLNIFATYPLLDNSLIQVAMVIVGALLAQIIVRQVVKLIVAIFVSHNKYIDEPNEIKRADTFVSVFSASISALVWLAAVIIILVVVKVNFAALATGAGLLGIVVGFGAQNTVRDFLAGIFILFENQYRIGDVISLSGGSLGAPTYGVVEDITLRITKLRSLDGTLNVVRNGEAAMSTNMTTDFANVVIYLGVTYDSSIDDVEKAMNKVSDQLLADDNYKKDIIEPIRFQRVNEFAESSVIVRAIGKVNPGTQWEIAGQYRRLVLDSFAKAGVQIALPQRVITNKSSSSKPKA